MKHQWIRVAAAAAVVASNGPQAFAQYGPYAAYRAQQQPPVASAPNTASAQVAAQQPLYQPYRPQVTATGPAGMPSSVPAASQAPAVSYPQVASRYQQPVASYPQTAQVAANYRQTAAAYPSTSYPQVATNYPQVSSTYGQASGPYSASAYSPATSYPQTAVASTYPSSTSEYSSTTTSPSTSRYSDYPTYSTVAQQSNDTLPPPDNSGPLPLPSRNGEPIDAENGAQPSTFEGEPENGTNGTNGAHGEATSGTNGAHMPRDGYNGYSTNGTNGTNGYAPANGTNGMYGYPTTSYPTHDGAGCAPAGDCNPGYPDYGLSGYFDNPGHNSQWFGGVYWLFMTRDDADFQRLTAQFETPAGGYPYYPTSERTVLTTSNGDHDYRNGAEVRFGSTFGGGGHDDCNSCGSTYGYGYGCDSGCNSCDVQEYAWEVGYWIIDDDVNVAEAIDSVPTDTDRMYGMKNFAGLEYNGRDVNDYYDYQMPVTDPTAPGATDVRILAQRVRTNFRAQNLELNFLHLPVCGVATCGAGYAGDECGGYGATECAPACGSPFSMTTLCGVRYLRLDDDFEYATMWGIDSGGTVTPPAYTPWDGANELFYDIKVDNELVGFQLGANMTYCITCNCSVFWNSNFGIYNNHIDVYQRVYGEAGPATYAQSGEEMTINADKDDVAFLGELLVGGSYAFNCNWRGTVAYRAIGITGVALSSDQMAENFSTLDHVALVDANGSIIIHGVQVGVECRY